MLYASALILAAAVVLPLWRPLLLAAVIAATLSSGHDRLARWLGGRRTLSAALFTLGVVVLILLPVAIATVLVVEQAFQLADVVRATLTKKGVAGLLQPLPDAIEHWIHLRYGEVIARPRELWSHVRALSGAQWALGAAAAAVQALWHVSFSLIMMLIALLFFLRDGHRLLDWVRRRSPLSPDIVDTLVTELSSVAKSVIGGNVLTGVAQSIAATAGYYIAGVPSPLLVGLLTLVASFIPSVGTALIALPIIAVMVLLGHVWWAVFLAAWMFIVVGLLDNVLRPLLMRGRSNLHGALIFFSLLGGVLAFGAIGLIVGPLALAFLLAMNATLHRSRPAPAG